MEKLCSSGSFNGSGSSCSSVIGVPVSSDSSDDEFYDCEEIYLHADAHVLGGLSSADEELKLDQQKAVSKWIGTLGKRLFSGSLSTTPAPIQIFEPQSYLQKISSSWRHANFLIQAAQTPDSLRRLELVLAWFVSGIKPIVDTWRKPFNPVLGETWQGEAEKGQIKCFCEQISHHPPIAAYVVKGPGFRMTGQMEAGVQLSMKWRGFKQVWKSMRRIEFDNGDVLDFTDHPQFMVKSCLNWAEVRCDAIGECTLRLSTKAAVYEAHTFFEAMPESHHPYNRSDALFGHITKLPNPSPHSAPAPHTSSPNSTSPPLDTAPEHSVSAKDSKRANKSGTFWHRSQPSPRKPEAMLSSFRARPLSQGSSDCTSQGSSLSGLLSSVSSASSRPRSSKDHAALGLQGVVAVFRGNWLSHLDISYSDKSRASERLWTLFEEQDSGFFDVKDTCKLGSDSSLREDLQLLAVGEVEKAGMMKERIENIQRKLQKTRIS